jgi:zinc finger HIT domain-containing protein 1
MSFLGEDEHDGGGKSAKGRARQTISDKRNLNDSGKKKKSTMNVRTALLYRKNLPTLIDESVSCNYHAIVCVLIAVFV